MNTVDARTLIQNVLTTLGYNVPNLANLLIGTMAQESAMGVYETQTGGGPARGIMQMENATYQDIWNNFLAYHQSLRQIIGSFEIPDGSTTNNADLLVNNHEFAVAMAACSYIRHHVPHPDTDPNDVHSLYVLYKAFYNGPGAATETEWTNNWNKYGIGNP